MLKMNIIHILVGVLKIINEKLCVNWARYDYLAKNLWSTKDIYASWFHINTKILIKMLIENNIKIKNKDEIDLFFVQLWDEAKKIVLPLALQAREAWIKYSCISLNAIYERTNTKSK